ncbi:MULTISPECIES: flavodoxin family protein [unclassified Oceanispirochaeta]|uniref:flavodoxin family protein n=1 Tax=unclassified Oceanispirochaeta TaxID=2635722 RepID=UPI000E093BC8|nr:MULTISPECIES: flavodoxin family protein [unclassified Oceanispirochaeta]MBF9015733.1 flavodoxin family protein [Oceanispirochaeta sp. M2]NPD72198.1 flavodoxin family protein [Oceanispirochaeta sp. M1]RDG32297.1 flavodoxin family protein [Oceanispirochaeta sp. M1]
MKVIAINGSPKKDGNTAQAMKLVCDELEAAGIETEIICIGNKLIRGCMGCGKCFKNRDEKCIFGEDGVNDIIQKMKDADGILLGSPVHYSGVSGAMKSFLDRAFYVSDANRGLFARKVGASVAAVRRSGGITTIDQLNRYLSYSEMLISSSNYWTVIHGTMPGEVLQDEEGIQIVRILGKNMAWLLNLVENGKGAVTAPEMEKKTMTNFIR